MIPTGSLARLLVYTTYFNTNTDLPTPDDEDYKVDNTSACYQQLLQVARVLVVCTICLGDRCVKTQSRVLSQIWGSTTGNKFRKQVRLYLYLHRIRATFTREASAVLYASRQRHQVMCCIDCCRVSAAPLAPGSANKSDLFLSHKVLYRSNITRYYLRSKYTPHEFAKHVFIGSIGLLCDTVWHARQFWEEHNHVTAVVLFNVVVRSLHGVSTYSFFEY